MRAARATTHHPSHLQDNPSGFLASKLAVEGNAIVGYVCKAARLCTARGVDWLVEQPRGSKLQYYEPWIDTVRDTGATSICFNMAAFGHSNLKPTRVWGTPQWLPAFKRHVDRLPMPLELQPLADSSGSSVTGRRADLQASAGYPPNFCDTIVAFHLAAQPRRGQEEDVLAKRQRVESAT